MTRFAADPQGSGFERIAAERIRQFEVEGYDISHDLEHHNTALAYAAACYAAPDTIYTVMKREGTYSDGVPHGELHWEEPWPANWRRNTDDRQTRGGRIRELEKAGALIAAEIDRLLEEDRRAQPE